MDSLKRIFIDVHEQPDCIDAWKLYIRKNSLLVCDSVMVQNIRNHFRKVHHYMFCYLEGLTLKKEFNQALLKYKTVIKS